MPMQPRPISETSRPLFPSSRFRISFSFRESGECLSLVVHYTQELRPVQIRPVELLLDTLERGVANRAVGPERYEPPSGGLGRGAHDPRVRLPAVDVRRDLLGRAELRFRAA